MRSAYKLHPLTHVFVCLGLSSVVFATSQVNHILILGVLAYLYAGLRLEGGFKAALKTLYHSLPLLLSIAIIQLLFRREGTIYWQFGWLRFSSVGAALSIQLSVRLLTVILCAKALAVLDFQDFSAAFAKLHFPEEFSFMLSYAVHLVPVFLAQIKGFVTGLKLRGIQPGKLSFKSRLSVYKMLAISALAGVIRGSTQVAIALELRGFRSEGKRTHLHSYPLKAIDYAAFVAFVGSMILLLYLL